MHEYEGGWNPVLAAPGSGNNYALIAANSTTEGSRGYGARFQGLSDKEIDDLCRQHERLAYSVALRYRGRGIKPNQLKAASRLGLVEAAKNFNPELGFAFWTFAQHRTEGAVKDLFDRGKFAPDYQRKESLNAPILFEDDDDEEDRTGLLIDESEPVFAPDLTKLTPKERTVIEARSADRTLKSVGKELGLSASRVHQIESKAHTKLRKHESEDPFRVARGNRDARQFCDEYKFYEGNFSKLQLRRGYRKPYRAPVNAKPGPLKHIKITKRLSGDDARNWSERLKSAETTDWGRRTAGDEKRFAAAESISWKKLEQKCGLGAVEIARQTSDEHLEKFFLSHHQFQRFRFDMRAKLSEENRIKRDGRWCSLERLGETSTLEFDNCVSRRLALGQVVESDRHPNDGLRRLNGVPATYEPKPSKQLKHQ